MNILLPILVISLFLCIISLLLIDKVSDYFFDKKYKKYLIISDIYNEYQNPEIYKYVYQKLYDITKQEKIKIFYLDDAILNKNKEKNKHRAGVYSFLTNMTVDEMLKETEKIKQQTGKDDYEYTFPKILLLTELYNKYDSILTLSHELGHHFLNIQSLTDNTIINSEENADNYIFNIFKKYIDDDYLMYCYVIVFDTYCKTNLDYDSNKYKITFKNYKKVEKLKINFYKKLKNNQ